MDVQDAPIKSVSEAETALHPFVSRQQRAAMRDLSHSSEEEGFFQEKLLEFGNRVASMPKTYDQDGKGDEAVAYLHYFHGGSDWYITEKDVDGGIEQAFGYTVLNGDTENAELGYISIAELTECGVDLDLHFEPRTLREVKAEIHARERRASHTRSVKRRRQGMER